jgi:hypothetical protein
MKLTAALVLGLLASAIAFGGDTIIYAPNGLARPVDGPDALIAFDSSDPAGYWTIGSMEVPNIGFGGLEFDRDGNLWAYAAFYKNTGGAASGLYRVDINTGQATLQGARSNQPLEDLAFNPIDDQMYGIRTQNGVTRLYTVNLASGQVAAVGVFSGMPQSQRAMGFAIDSAGHHYVHDMSDDRIYAGSGLELSQLYQLPQDTSFSQGMTIDWSRDDRGYHAAVGYGEFPHYFSQLNTFAIDGAEYVLGPDFGPEGSDGFPAAEPGDLAIRPATATNCPSDLDGDGTVGLADLAVLLAHFGTTEGAGREDGDLDLDGDVDLADLAAMLADFGTVCP